MRPHDVPPTPEPNISVVIPVYNEREHIARALASLSSNQATHEVIVVDDGSTDGTSQWLASQAPATVAPPRPGDDAPPPHPPFPQQQVALAPQQFSVVKRSGPRGRGAALNTGAARARGGIFLFLHADCRLNPGDLDQIVRVIGEGCVGGGFLKRYDPLLPFLLPNQWWLNRIRAAAQKQLVGTNAIFCSRDSFDALGGFEDIPLLEDVCFSDALRRLGPVAVLGGPVWVSSRKYAAGGAIRRTLRNTEIMLRYRLFGESPSRLAHRYRKH